MNTRRVVVPSVAAAQSLRPYVEVFGVGGQLNELDTFIAQCGRKQPLCLRLAVKSSQARKLIKAYAAIDWKENRNVVLLVSPDFPGTAVATPKQDSAADERLAKDLALPIEELDLTVGSYNPLKGDGINTIGELVQRTEAGLLEIRYIKGKRLGEIKAKLCGMGLKLADALTEAA